MTPPRWLHWPAAAGGGGGSWVPSDSADVYAWWRADSLSGTLSDGDQVNSWYDEISSYELAREAGSTGFPKFVTGALNLLPGIEFDGGGSGSRLYHTFTVGEWSTSLNQLDHMIAVVFRTDVTSGVSSTAYWQNQGAIECHRSAGKASAVWWGSTFGHTPGATSLGTTTTHIAIATYDINTADNSGTRELWLNGSQDASASMAASTNTWGRPVLRLGSNAGTQTFDGMIYETLFAHAIDTTTRQKVEGYLAHRYGLTANLPSGHPYKSSAP